jgi:hypothetical protein
MFNEKQVFLRVKEANSSSEEPVTLPEPNDPDTFEKGVKPKK